MNTTTNCLTNSTDEVQLRVSVLFVIGAPSTSSGVRFVPAIRQGLELVDHDATTAFAPTGYFWRGQNILLERKRIKRKTIERRRLQHREAAA